MVPPVIKTVFGWLEPLQQDLHRIASGRHHDPHAVLGAHQRQGALTLLAYLPAVQAVQAAAFELERLPNSDFFCWQGTPGQMPAHYQLNWTDRHGVPRTRVDPYSFAPAIDTNHLAAFSEGHHTSAWKLLGAQRMNIDGIDGVRFSTWAPNAERVSVVGPFCDWDGRHYPMRVLSNSGVWEIFIPGLEAGELYKFEIRNRTTGAVRLKTDPYGRAAEQRPGTASLVVQSGHHWRDGGWLAARAQRDWLHAPMSIYEVHSGSWRRHDDGRFYSWSELASELIPYVRDAGFTHIELLPITEHPLDDSWGYQTTGFFAPTSRHGSPDGLRQFIDQCHQSGIGVLLDWVPGHFPRDAHGLANFDGAALYEYHDPRKAEHRDWGTLIFNYERHEVRAFLISSACYWLEEFHFDGLRVDAVASMLYLDFGRQHDYVPNRHGGRHNLEAIDFLRALNATTHTRFPGTVVIAEESTDWPQVSRPTDGGGLGFSMKWNMGWMHDTLSYFTEDPLHRQHHHHKLTFAMMYAYTENFVLPLSHDEVVHLKRSLFGRMPGDRWQQFANLRLLYSYMWTFPGKKLLFMGSELAQPWEWDFRQSLPWWLLDHAEHRGVQRTVTDLNRLYRNEPALHELEFEPRGFSWLDCDDAASSVLSYLRHGDDRHLIVALNFTPVPRYGYRVGAPHGGHYREVFNSDSSHYGGSNLGNAERMHANSQSHQGQQHSLAITLPPLGALILAPE
jgi:1,4-alpha-glucan branching enzyme